MSLTSLQRRRRVLPGFGLSMGVALTYFALIILLPLVAMAIKTASIGLGAVLEDRHRRRARSPRSASPSPAALAATVFNAVVGLLFAWVLTRYRFPGPAPARRPGRPALRAADRGRRLTLVTLLGPNGWFGRFLEPLGIKVAYTPLGIIGGDVLHLDPLRGPHRAAGARGRLGRRRGGGAQPSARGRGRPSPS